MDALARVHTWMRLFQTTIDKAATGRFALKAREEAGTQQNLCAGGAILSLDLKQAFDRVNRAALAASLERLGAPQDLIAAVIALHDSSAYHIQDAYHDSEVLTTSSIRQGCKLAPLLWVAISTTVLHQLRDALSGPKRQGTTFADDTLCQWLIETEEDIHSLSKMMAQVLKVMDRSRSPRESDQGRLSSYESEDLEPTAPCDSTSSGKRANGTGRSIPRTGPRLFRSNAPLCI